MAMACSAPVPRRFCFALVIWRSLRCLCKVAAERGHGNLEVAALLLDFEGVLLAFAIPMILEQSPL